MTLLIIMCVFSKWVEVVVLASRDAETVWQAFFETIICRYGMPLGVWVDREIQEASKKVAGKWTLPVLYLPSLPLPKFRRPGYRWRAALNRS